MKRTMKRAALCLLIALLSFASVSAIGGTVQVQAADRKMAVKDGWKKKNGKRYCYYRNGKKVTGVVKIGSKYYAFNSKGILQRNVRVFQDGSKYYSVDENGVATRWKGAEHYGAKVILKKCTAKKYSDKLQQAFIFCKDLSYRVVEIPAGKTDAQQIEYCAEYGLKNRAGDCAVQACSFYVLAKMLGYDAKVINGYVYNQTAKTFGAHTWVELERWGKAYVCDPNFSHEYGDEKGVPSSRPGLPLGFRVRYGSTNTLPYCRSNNVESMIPANGKA